MIAGGQVLQVQAPIGICRGELTNVGVDAHAGQTVLTFLLDAVAVGIAEHLAHDQAAGKQRICLDNHGCLCLIGQRRAANRKSLGGNWQR